MQPTMSDPAKQPHAITHTSETWSDRYAPWIVGAVAFLLLLLLVVFRVSR